MFALKFSTENWIGNRNKATINEVQTWAEIKSAIEELDAKKKTLVTIETNGNTHMAVGGGMGKYVVYATFDNVSLYNLIEPTKSNDLETLVVGGQIGAYPARMCVDLETVLKAAKTFTESGTLEESVIWEIE